MKKLNTFDCESCGETFDRTQESEDESIKQYENQFGTFIREEIMIVCGYCYKVAMEYEKVTLIENWDVNRMTKQ